MSEVIRPEGIKTFQPHEKAPDFVKGILVISLNKLVKFCKDNPELLTEYKGEKQLKCKMLDGKYGIDIQVDTWKPEGNKPEPMPENDTENLPF